MANFFARRGAAYWNELNRSLGALVGIATGMLGDRHLSDAEIDFLSRWLKANEAIANAWPGDVIYERVRSALADGGISEVERIHLVDTLQSLIGGTLDDLAESTHATSLALDDVPVVIFADRVFCLTGDFAFGPRDICADETKKRGGTVKSGVSMKVHYLVVGGLGSPEWKQGSFGTKIEKAMEMKHKGAQLLLVHEDVWAKSFHA